jgi:hypothetical protein
LAGVGWAGLGYTAAMAASSMNRKRCKLPVEPEKKQIQKYENVSSDESAE